MNLSISERRAIGNQAAGDPEFRALLLAQPHEAVRRATGHPLDKSCSVEVVEEGDEWGFVLVEPGIIEVDLPDAVDARSAVENGAYGLLRDDPSLRDAMQHDPTGFARQWLGVDLKDESVVLHAEAHDTLIVLIPNREHREELDDDAMDLVAGGGQQGTNCPEPKTGRG